MAKEQKDVEFPHSDFAKRLNDAANSNPAIPALNMGRLTFIANELKRRDVEVSVETVRKWFVGETRPRQSRLSTLAAILRVDEMSLLTDHPERFSEEPKVTIDNPVLKLAAAMLELEGAHIAFPQEGDDLARNKAIDMYAIVNGKMVSITVVESEKDSDGVTFHVPAKASGNTVLGIARVSPFTYEVMKFDWGRATEATDEVIESKVADLCWMKVNTLSTLS